MTTTCMGEDGEPFTLRFVTRGDATFEVREWPLRVARWRNSIEYREPVRAQKRVAGGRFGSVVVS